MEDYEAYLTTLSLKDLVGEFREKTMDFCFAECGSAIESEREVHMTLCENELYRRFNQ